MIELINEFIRGLIKNDELIFRLKEIVESEEFSAAQKEDLKKLILNIEEEMKSRNDGMVLFSKVYELLMDNNTYINLCKNMSAKDVMELATKNITLDAPSVGDEFLEEMVEAALESDNPVNVWRMAFNYNYRIEDKTKLVDYIIAKNDAMWIAEFISSDFIGVDTSKLIDALIDTKDIKEMSFIMNYNISNECKAKLKNAIKKLKTLEN